MKSRARVCSRVFVLVCLVQTTLLRADEDVATAADVARVIEVCDLIADQHAEPPVRQQLILLAARSMYVTQNKDVPRGLSQKVSQLTKADEFASLLKSVAADVGAVNATSVIRDFAAQIRGGGSLIEAEQASVEAKVVANQYVGVGIALSMEGGLPFITTSFYGGPGYKAGVKNQDTILEIDGLPTEGKSLGRIVKELRGEAGTDVKLRLKHPTVGEREIVVTRNVTFIPTVHGAAQDDQGKWNYRLPDQPDIALFAVDRFGASTAHELRKLERQLSDKPLSGIILDLRRGGGTLHHVVLVADQFLEAGVIGSIKIGDKESTYKSEAGSLFEGVPLVVLTGTTSSASSVFLAAALQDRDRAVVVGAPTNGMSYVRSQLDLSNGDKLIIPTGYVHRANGTVLFSRQSTLLGGRPQSRSMENTDRKSANLVVPDYPLADDKDEILIAQAIKIIGRKSD